MLGGNGGSAEDAKTKLLRLRSGAFSYLELVENPPELMKLFYSVRPP